MRVRGFDIKIRWRNSKEYVFLSNILNLNIRILWKMDLFFGWLLRLWSEFLFYVEKLCVGIGK